MKNFTVTYMKKRACVYQVEAPDAEQARLVAANLFRREERFDREHDAMFEFHDVQEQFDVPESAKIVLI